MNHSLSIQNISLMYFQPTAKVVQRYLKRLIPFTKCYRSLQNLWSQFVTRLLCSEWEESFPEAGPPHSSAGLQGVLLLLGVFHFLGVTAGPWTARLDYNLILEVALVSGDDFCKLPLSTFACACRISLTLGHSLRMKQSPLNSTRNLSWGGFEHS